ncbi:unnamed protein product (macronuclear) [Paramecium tetraurelia]|uniref:Major facilitator superfamily associated domain-containing protein n=1 Tax=Paramecium tetraurelia TaxID=5888 RepID=A0EAM9_PARTE|nr:uncharacterized protein GSPATT00025080001 [Paramecium tetraurelia]CAK92346.1 unnamed protein product [Paramecium tetraurelia]|eukprot:XP_001459743.1 hypothetical protein (macronuclear) [Paramecium tetraurelia strain d4-2]
MDFGFILCQFLGIQDIAIDGLATDLCKLYGESAAALIQNIGFTIGNSLLGSFLFIALHSSQHRSLETSFLILSILGLILTIILHLNLFEQVDNKKAQPPFRIQNKILLLNET